MLLPALLSSLASLCSSHPTSGLATNLVGQLFHTHDGLPEHPVSEPHDYHVHDGLAAHPVSQQHATGLDRRYGFPSTDMEEYGGWEEQAHDYSDYGAERSGQDGPFDDPFFKAFQKPRKKVAPTEPSRPKPQKVEAPATTPFREVTPATDTFVQGRPAKGPNKVVKVQKEENSEMIREFTLMISKLLFQLSQMKA